MCVFYGNLIIKETAFLNIVVTLSNAQKCLSTGKEMFKCPGFIPRITNFALKNPFYSKVTRSI